MILQRLTLNNFGLYGRENIFNLAPNRSGGRPIILIRGHNGSGKTTFLEGVRLALYGKRSLGPRIARATYEQYLHRRIYELSKNRHASVQLTFARQEEGIMHLYEVTRSWAARGASVIETLDLTRDGERFRDIAAEYWDHYLEDMIPTGVSQLFFFDGEKIQDIADEETTLAIRDAVRALLGLDMVSQLRSDLAIYTSRRDTSSSDIDLEAIERDLEAARSELVLVEEEAAQCRAERFRSQSRIDRAEKVFQDEGGTWAIDLAGLKQTLREVEKRIELLKNELKRIAAGVQPLRLAPLQIERLRDRLNILKKRAHSETITDFVNAFSKNVTTTVSDGPLWTNSHFEALRAYVATESDTNTLTKLDAEPDWIIERLNRINDDSCQEAADLGVELDAAYRKRSRLKAQIKGFDAGSARNALDRLKAAEYELGVADTQLSQMERTIASLRHRISTLTAEHARAIDIHCDIKNAIHKVDLAERTRAALAVYESRILNRRIETLSSHFLACFNGLIQKKRLFRKVRVDPESFNFSLIGEDGIEIHKNRLSAGERQVFAISVLWALGKTSGLELPMIIDTPLSRLDTTHRKAIMASYIPNASRQVILLCTDSELTQDLDGIIAPYVARRYEIQVKSGSRSTEVAEVNLEITNAH